MIQQGNLFKVDFNWTIFIQIRVIKTWYNDSKTAHTLRTDWFIFLVQIRVKKMSVYSSIQKQIEVF